MTQFRLISRRNAVSGTVPSASVLVAGELAVNTADGGLYSLLTFGPLSGTVQLIRSSTSISSSYALSSSFAETSSYALTAQTVLGTVASSSYAATASVLLGSIVSASYALTASYALNGGSGGGSGLFASSSVSSSWASSSLSSSYALTSSYALNGGGSGNTYIGAMREIESIITTGSQPSVTFSAIPSTYKDLMIVVDGRGTNASTAVTLQMQFNGDSGSNYASTRENRFSWVNTLTGTGIEIGSVPAASTAASYRGTANSWIRNYASSSMFRSVLAQSSVIDGTTVVHQQSAGWWKDTTNIISQITLTLSAGNFFGGSVFTLYGIGGDGGTTVPTASYALQALSASWAPSVGGGSGLFASSSVSSSWASSSLSSSYALTASYALNGGGSGGNFTSYQAPIGYNVIGAGSETTVQRRVYLKAVSSSYDGMILGISAYVTNNASDNVQDYSVVVMSDNAGSAGRVLAYNRNTLQSVLLESASAAPTSRWLSVPISVAITSGTVYWIGVQNNTVTGQGTIAYDTGSDSYYTSAGDWFTDGGFYTLTSTTRNYSIFANQMYANAGIIPSASYALTASYALNGGGGPSVSSSYALTSSYSDTVFGGTYITSSLTLGDVEATSAALNATYLTLSTNSDLPNERVLTPSSRFNVADSGSNQPYHMDLSRNMRTSTIALVVDGGTSAITTGSKLDVLVPFSCSLQSWTMLANQTGSIKIDVWKAGFASFPPTVANSIVGSIPVSMSNAQSSQSVDLTGWTTELAANDTLRFYVSASVGIQRVNLTLTVLRL